MLGNYQAFIFSSLLDGSIVTDNNQINEITEKYTTGEIDDFTSFQKDVETVIDLYTEDLLKDKKLKINEDILTDTSLKTQQMKTNRGI